MTTRTTTKIGLQALIEMRRTVLKQLMANTNLIVDCLTEYYTEETLLKFKTFDEFLDDINDLTDLYGDAGYAKVSFVNNIHFKYFSN